MPDAVVLDVEGTTSPITYVHDYLFPYSAARISHWVTRTDPEVTAVVDEARRDAGLPEGDLDAVAGALRAWIRDDAKVPSLKSLQGMIWADGFASGDLQAPVYDDVPPALDQWTRTGISAHIYSSGSVQAQQTWFVHSDQGDLTAYLSGHFDTRNAGPKYDPASYHRIGHALRTSPDALLFLSDDVGELDAAAAAGWQTIALHRTDPAPPRLGAHPVATTFSQITLSATGATIDEDEDEDEVNGHDS